MRDSHVEPLREVIGSRWNAFRRGVRRGDPPARVDRRAGARPVKARPRVYNPIVTSWLAACMVSLEALGIVFQNVQAVWASAAMPTPKKGGFRMVSDFRAANQQVEKVPGVMPNQEASIAKLSEAIDFTAAWIFCKATGNVRWRPTPKRYSRSPRQVDCTHLRVSRQQF